MKDLIKVRNFCSQNVRQGFSEFTKCMSNGHFQPVYYSFIRILPPLDWPSTLIFPPGTGHQLTVPIGKADPAPPRVMSADLREVNGALTPAGRFAATPTPPPGEQQERRQAGDSPMWDCHSQGAFFTESLRLTVCHVRGSSAATQANK